MQSSSSRHPHFLPSVASSIDPFSIRVEAPRKFRVILPKVSDSAASLDTESNESTDELALSSNLKDNAHVAVPFIWNLSKFHIIAEEDELRLVQMHNMINSLVERNALNPPETEPIVGKLMLAAYSKDGIDEISYYRAKIVEIDREFVDALFVDLGDTERMAYIDMFEIPFELQDIPIYGITFSMPSIPEEAQTLISQPVLNALEAKHSVGLIRVESDEEKFAWTGTFHSRHGPSWQQIVSRVLSSLGHNIPLPNLWNPWSLEACQVLKSSSGSQLDTRTLQQALGQEYLVEFASRTHYEYILETVNHQLNAMKNISTIWRDNFLDFYYCEADIPPPPLLSGSQIEVRIGYFHDFNEWGGAIVSEPYETYRQSLCEMLKVFCEDFLRSNYARAFKLLPGQVCFVCVPTWAAIDRMMMKEKGKGNWKPRLNRRSDEDDKQAGMWFRAVVVGHCGATHHESSCVEVYLIDVGRFLPVQKRRIVPAIFRYLIIPKLGIKGKFAPAVSGSQSAVGKYYYDRIPKGSKIPCTVLTSNFFGTTCVELPSQVEEMIQASIPDQPKPLEESKYVGGPSENSSYSLYFDSENSCSDSEDEDP